MGNLKKELTRMGVTDNVLRSRILEFVKQEGKHLSSEQILSLLQDFIAHPEQYKQHSNPRWRALAEMLSPEVTTAQHHELREAPLPYSVFGRNLIDPLAFRQMDTAMRLPSILPPLTLNEALETTKIHSVAGKMSRYASLIAVRPFRSPHHTISDVALVGGGTHPQPGEISLAHNGVLFLDELPEFKRQVLEVMRQPLEDRCVTISRSQYSVEFPASFMFVAAMNPCPCGNYNHPTIACTCKPGEVQSYLGKVSGPLMDRIDLHVEVVPVSHEELASSKPVEKSADIRKRVVAAREIQKARFANHYNIFCNAQMTSRMVRQYCIIDEAGQQILKDAMDRLGLSARAYDRILKVARTIADLDSSPDIGLGHLSEAINYRSLDRDNWGKK